MNSTSFQARRVLVTASSQGIGRALALHFAVAGASVVVHGIETTGEIEQTVTAIRMAGGIGVGVQADLGVAADRERLIKSCHDALDGIDVLVLNAGLQIRAGLNAITGKDLSRQFAVNVEAGVSLVQAFLPQMRARQWGRIVAVGSIQELRPHPDLLGYAITKAAQANFVRGIASIAAGDGVTVNSVAPGVIATQRNAAALSDPAYADSVLAKIPAGRLGHPEDVVGLVSLLCSDAGGYINGANIPVDGGMHL